MAITETRDLTADGRLVLGATSGPPDHWGHVTAAQEPDGPGQADPGASWRVTLLPAEEPERCLAPASRVMEMISDLGGGRVVWWTVPIAVSGEESECGDQELASSLGMTLSRELHELAIALPLAETADGGAAPGGTAPAGGAAPGITTPAGPWRTLDPAVDLPSMLEANNAAFEWHPDQGGWTLDDLESRIRDEELIASDVVVCGDPGAIAGFCWTKAHSSRNPPEGEIFVIGVHPDHQGRGLGRELTERGLAHLNTVHGADVGTLFVESTNAVARHLYSAMGFEHRRTMRCWETTVASRR